MDRERMNDVLRHAVTTWWHREDVPAIERGRAPMSESLLRHLVSAIEAEQAGHYPRDTGTVTAGEYTYYGVDKPFEEAA